MLRGIAEFLGGAFSALALVISTIVIVVFLISVFACALYALTAIPALLIYGSYKLASTSSWPVIGYQTIWSCCVILVLVGSWLKSIFKKD